MRHMFEFCKQVLLKVSFDRELFRKELIKSIKFLGKDEVIMLEAWCVATFGHQYQDVLREVLGTSF